VAVSNSRAAASDNARWAGSPTRHGRGPAEGDALLLAAADGGHRAVEQWLDAQELGHRADAPSAGSGMVGRPLTPAG